MTTPDSLEALRGALLRLARVYRQRALDGRQQARAHPPGGTEHAGYLSVAVMYDGAADDLEALLPAALLQLGNPSPEGLP
jgi:hypothetical protein